MFEGIQSDLQCQSSLLFSLGSETFPKQCFLLLTQKGQIGVSCICNGLDGLLAFYLTVFREFGCIIGIQWQWDLFFMLAILTIHKHIHVLTYLSWDISFSFLRFIGEQAGI